MLWPTKFNETNKLGSTAAPMKRKQSSLDGRSEGEVLEALTSIKQRVPSDPFVSIIQITTEGKGKDGTIDYSITNGVDAGERNKAGAKSRKKTKQLSWLVQLTRSTKTNQQLHRHRKFLRYDLNQTEEGLNHHQHCKLEGSSSSKIKDKHGKHQAAHTCVVTVTTTDAKIERQSDLSNPVKDAVAQRSSSFTCATAVDTDSSLSSADYEPNGIPAIALHEMEGTGVGLGVESMQQKLHEEGIEDDNDTAHGCDHHAYSQTFSDNSSQPFLKFILSGNCKDGRSGNGDTGNACCYNAPFHCVEYDDGSTLASNLLDSTTDNDLHPPIEENSVLAPSTGGIIDAIDDSQDGMLNEHFTPLIKFIRDMTTTTFPTSNVDVDLQHQNRCQETQADHDPLSNKNGLEEGSDKYQVSEPKKASDAIDLDHCRKSYNEAECASSGKYSLQMSNSIVSTKDQRSASTAIDMWDYLLQKDLQYCSARDEIYHFENEIDYGSEVSPVPSLDIGNSANETIESIEGTNTIPCTARACAHDTIVSDDSATVGSLSLTPLSEVNGLLDIGGWNQDVGSLVRDMSAIEIVLDRESGVGRLQDQEDLSRGARMGSAATTEVVFSKLDKENRGSPKLKSKASPIRVLSSMFRQKLPVADKKYKKFHWRPSNFDISMENEKMNLFHGDHASDAAAKFSSTEIFRTDFDTRATSESYNECCSEYVPLLFSDDVGIDTRNNEKDAHVDIEQHEKRPNFGAEDAESEQVSKEIAEREVERHPLIDDAYSDETLTSFKDTCTNIESDMDSTKSSYLDGESRSLPCSASFQEAPGLECNELYCGYTIASNDEGTNATNRSSSHQVKGAENDEQCDEDKNLKHRATNMYERLLARRRRRQFDPPDYHPRMAPKFVNGIKPARPASQTDWIY